MEIYTSSLFERQYERLPRQLKENAKQKEILFRADPFHPSLDTHKLHGKDKDMWAFSINRKTRIKFLFLTGSNVLFVEIGSHDVYR